MIVKYYCYVFYLLNKYFLSFKDYPDINAVWEKFNCYFIALGGILSQKWAFQDYIRQGMKEALADGVSYFEFRGVVPDVRYISYV